jgi:hypothetical protein
MSKAKVEDWRLANPGGHSAQQSVEMAVKNGLLKKPNICVLSDSTCIGRLEAHHPNGYSEEHKFDIIWLCQSHHRRAHIGKTK